MTRERALKIDVGVQVSVLVGLIFGMHGVTGFILIAEAFFCVWCVWSPAWGAFTFKYQQKELLWQVAWAAVGAYYWMAASIPFWVDVLVGIHAIYVIVVGVVMATNPEVRAQIDKTMVRRGYLVEGI